MNKAATDIEVPILKGSKTLTGRIPTPCLRELSEGDSIPDKHGVFRVLTIKDGDKRFTWNPYSIVEINEARVFFNNCVKEGLVPYKVGTGGQASAEVMDEFDPFAGEVIFAPVAAVVGG